MVRILVGVLSIFMFNLTSSSPISHGLFRNEPSVFGTNWRSEILNPNAIGLHKPCFLTTTEISNIQVNDSIQMQKTSSDASRVTFGKIVLESLGAAAGGTVIGLLCYKTTKDIIFWGGAITFTGVSFGLAGGTTLVGNLLMEPNGSFIKSLIGSSLGLGLGSVIFYAALYASVPGDHPTHMPQSNPLLYSSIFISAFLPIAGAVSGYNHGNFRCCLSEIDEQQNIEFCFDHLSKIPFKVQIVSIKF